ncbi:MAG: hypothetical protein ABI857_12590 [Acidobacteriota bacterium]
MEKDTKNKSEEYKRFEELTKKLVSVPRKEIQEREKKNASEKEAPKRKV